MPSRHRSRERALQMIYQWDLSRAPTDCIISAFWDGLSNDEPGVPTEPDPFANDLVEGVVGRIEHIDDLIRSHAENWRLDRMPTIDRGILRLAIYEMICEPSLSPVVINEALEIGRRFSEDSGPFLNGVLDAVRRTLEENAPAPA